MAYDMTWRSAFKEEKKAKLSLGKCNFIGISGSWPPATAHNSKCENQSIK